LVFRYVMAESAEITDRLVCREMPVDQGIAGFVFQSGKGIITDDVDAEAHHYRVIERDTHYHTRNMVTVPLRTSARQTIGVMQVLNRRNGAFSEADLEVLEILAAQAASAIETATLYARVLEIENDRKRFYREVIRCVTGGKLHLVAHEELSPEGRLALDLP